MLTLSLREYTVWQAIFKGNLISDISFSWISSKINSFENKVTVIENHKQEVLISAIRLITCLPFIIILRNAAIVFYQIPMGLYLAAQVRDQ